MADNIAYRFIQNVGDYFPSGYFTEEFLSKVQNCAGYSADEMKNLCHPYVALRSQYEDYKNFIINNSPRVKDAIKQTHDWHTKLLKNLGYPTDDAYSEPYVVKTNEEGISEMIPVRHILRSGDRVSMLVMEMQNLIPIDECEPAGLFEQQYESDSDRNTKEQRYYAKQWEYVIPAKYLDRDKYHFCPAIINKAVTQIFLMPEERRPRYILMMAGNMIFLFDQDKWARGSYLQFSIDELFVQGQIPAFRNYYALFHLLCRKETLCADGQVVLMDTLIEESYKSAYEVTKDLKEGVVLAVETLANEALYYKKSVQNQEIVTNESFATEVKDDCLTIVYRLLFILFAESRPELEILPTGDNIYKLGYSLESLRDLEQVRLISDETRNGYFFDDSIKKLFHVLSSGFNADRRSKVQGNKSFYVRPIDSPVFNDNRLKQLKDVRIRNVKWQEIIKALSLSKSRKYCGRISYANLGVNQLGSVYESLLAFRGFYAEEDLIEVHKADAPEDGTFLVPYSRMGAFNINEVLCDLETGEPKRLPKGTFVYRLNGRDRQKSASFYTPEVLTRSTVKYTIKTIVEEVRDKKRKPEDLLDLKILEPAVGAAAFLNEVINQLADAYLTYVEKKPSPDEYRNELQKIKAYIATHNVYGVDLNPTAIELGKLSLWLNVIHTDMETPFFGNRLSTGNAVIGAWLKVYYKSEVLAESIGYNKFEAKEWWTKAPHKIEFYSNKVKRSVNEVYHFLLPDKNMLGVLGISEMKKAHPTESQAMQNKLKDWTKPIKLTDFQKLLKLSAKIDIRLREAFETQVNIERLTNNRANLWGISGAMSTLDIETYSDKERIFDTRNRRDNAYYKLKLVMDYWCSLWFWEYEDASSLPTREEYWTEIENLLDVSDENLDANTQRVISQNNLFDSEIKDSKDHMTEEEANIVEKSKTDILESTTSHSTLLLEEEPQRFKIAKRLSQKYHFFHPMLEFIEVFWLRDGFDIICGNPPWLKLQFDDKAVMSERFPEVVIHKVSAPDTRRMQSEILADPYMRSIYDAEQIEIQCSGTFMNAYANYPLLVGQQTNLYKCVLTNCFTLSSDSGYIGILCPESIYDDPKGQPLRQALYHRLRYHFQYQNELRLFAEVDHHVVFGSQILGSNVKYPSFLSIHNLFHPNTVDACFAHDGHGECGGIKDENNNWNTQAHTKRIVRFSEDELRVLAKTFEDSEDWETTKLVSIHNNEIVKVLHSLGDFETHVSDYEYYVSTGLSETGAVDNNIIKRNTLFPNWDEEQMIYSGPHYNVCNPLYKTPRSICNLNSDYDIIDLESINDEFSARTNYIPIMNNSKYHNLIKGFVKYQNSDGEEVFENWIDYYRFAIRNMLSQGGERTIIGAILPPKSSHINTVVSIAFRDLTKLVEFAGITSSVVFDFYCKTIGSGHFQPGNFATAPLGVADIYKLALFARTLRLNCVTNRYSDLWKEVWNTKYKEEQWSINDKRLKFWDILTEEWTHDTPLRNYFERRQALVEIDVIVAMALGLTLDELIMMYEIQFPVLQQYENDTWFDRNGRIVFTCSKGLIGVGVDRPTWNKIRGEQINELSYRGEDPSYTHTLTSELYNGKQIVYESPYTRCDRVEDYKTAWKFFEERFK